MPMIKVGGEKLSSIYRNSFIFRCDNCGSYSELSEKEANEAREKKNLLCIGCGSEIDPEKYNRVFRRF